MDKGALLDRLGLAGEDRLALAKVLDKAEQASGRNIPAATDFLSPQQRAQALDLLHLAGISESAYVLQGGYEGAERQVLQFLPDWMEPESAEAPIRCLRAVFREEEKLSHRDFLGSLMGMGIVREKVGDILVAPEARTFWFWRALRTSCCKAGTPPGERSSGFPPSSRKTSIFQRFSGRRSGTRCPRSGWTRWRPPASDWPGVRPPPSLKAARCSSTGGSA